jgi:hypothetical protein
MVNKHLGQRPPVTRTNRSAAHGPLRAAAVALAFLMGSTAGGVPTATDQRTRGLADTPGTKASVPSVEIALRNDYPRTEHGMVVLDSDVLLKTYYFAYSGGPIDGSAILTQNTENIVVPTPVRATRTQVQSLERLVKLAREHRRLLILATDVALDPYDPVSRSFSISNRLFTPGARYYFDNSAYHYVYRGAEAFHSFKVTDKVVLAAIEAAIGRYEHFSVEIVGRVADGAASESTLQLEVEQVTLKGADGEVLLTQPATTLSPGWQSGHRRRKASAP